MVLRKKTRLPEAERSPILQRLRELKTTAEDPVVRERRQSFLDRLV